MVRLSRHTAVVVGLLIAFSLAGCGSGPASPAVSLLSDPSAIVTRSFQRLEATTALHFEGSISGSVDAASVGSLLGGGSLGLSGKIKLDGSSFSGDLDLGKAAAHVSASFPSLFGAAADAILVDGTLYTKITTPVGPANPLYTKSKPQASLLPSLAPGNSVVSDLLKQLEPQVDAAAASAILLTPGSVDGRAAYHLLVTVPPDVVHQVLGLAGGAFANDLSIQVAPVDYWVYTDTLAPAGLQFRVTSATLGSLSVALTLTRYDQPVSIAAPPDGQVGGG